MKKFTKLALAASVALSANAMAMQAMDDSTLSATTGQDGISIGIGISKVAIEKVFVHDNDGLDGDIANAGAIVIKGKERAPTAADWLNPTTASHGVVIGANYAALLDTNNLLDLKIDSDAGDIGTGGAFLNIAADVSGLNISIGEIGVTASGTAETDSIRRGGNTTVRDAATNPDSPYNAILSGLDIVTGKMTANIQVGAAPQGAMIKLNTTIQGGLEIKNLGILDNSTKGQTAGFDLLGFSTQGVPNTEDYVSSEAGEIFIESIKIANSNSLDLEVNTDIKVFNDSTTAGGKTKDAHIRIISNDTGKTTDQYIKGIHLGSRTAASIGDVEIQGLQTYYSPSAGAYTKGAVITISGH